MGWKICGLDLPTTGQVTYFAKDEGTAIDANEIDISASSYNWKVPISSETGLGFNKIVVTMERFYPTGKYCPGRSYRMPKYELWNCKDVSTLNYSGGDEAITVLLYDYAGGLNQCAYVATFGVKEDLKKTSCNSQGDLGKFRVFPGAKGNYKNFVLRPKGAVTYKDKSSLGLDVCVNNSGQTQDCGNSNLAEISFLDENLSTGIIILDGHSYIRVEEVSGCWETWD